MGKISMRSRLEGKPTLSPATPRLGSILRLLWHHAGLDGSADAEGSEIQLYKCDQIFRELSAPGGKTVQTEAFAAVGESDTKGRKVIVIAGDPEDYAAELEEIL